MEIWLIRHGDTLKSTKDHYNFEKKAPNPPLTELGVRQAQALAKRLERESFDRIISSDLDRAVETALPIMEKRSLVLEQSPFLREMDFGDMCCNSWSNFPEYHEQFKQHVEDLPYPNGENGQDVWERCSQLLDTLDYEADEKVAIICHGGVIRVLVCGLLGLPQNFRYHFGRPVYHCSITRLRFFKGKATLHTLNDHGHILGICPKEREDEV